MKIAVPYENGNIFPHFGRTVQFKLYVVENGQVHRHPDSGHPRPGPRRSGRPAGADGALTC